MARTPVRQLTKPMEVPMLPFAVAGTVIWALAALALLLWPGELAADTREQWLRICLAGVAAGVVGIVTMYVHDRNR